MSTPTAVSVKVDKVEQPDLAKHDLKKLDLAFAMDCTGSMGSYIQTARDNIRQIVEEIVRSEKGDVRLALVEYRDHPPQDSSFVTRVNDFTPSSSKMKKWLEECQASGGGDTPEAVADALHDVLKLNWREDATKICVCISDAPPHGLGCRNDGFPNGCPAGIDPIEVCEKIAEKAITIYMVGCEPSITPYKDFFLAVAYKTGGQYVPLTKAQLLTKVIVGGAQEEMSLEQLMEEVNADIQADLAAGLQIDEDEMAKRAHKKFMSKGVKTKQLRRNNLELENASSSELAHKFSSMSSLAEVRKDFKEKSEEVAFDSPLKMVSEVPRSKHARKSKGVFGCPPPPMVRGAPKGTAPFDADLLPEMLVNNFEAGPVMNEDVYECAEDDITLNQAQRLVQRSMARNMVKKK